MQCRPAKVQRKKRLGDLSLQVAALTLSQSPCRPEKSAHDVTGPKTRRRSQPQHCPLPVYPSRPRITSAASATYNSPRDGGAAYWLPTDWSEVELLCAICACIRDSMSCMRRSSASFSCSMRSFSEISSPPEAARAARGACLARRSDR